MNIILYSVPAFFILIGIELIAERLRGTDYYRVNDALTSLATGTLNQIMRTTKLLIPFTVYVFVYQQFAFFELQNTPAVWVLAFVLYDFCYYWNHRLGHEMNLLWAAHVVHHSSEEYNLSTALRQTGTSYLSFIFYIPGALLGIDPLTFATVGAINLVYQFWVHTQHIGKLGWADRVFVTPSNHRVHHAQNGVYIDRNYGGVFVLWDRLFGSFQEELDEQPVIFGIRGALQTWNPIWANLHVYSQLFNDALHTKNWWHKFTIWFRRTGWRPPDVVEAYPISKTDLANFEKFDTQLAWQLKAYAVIHYVTTAVVALSYSFAAAQILPLQQLGLVAFVLVSVFSIGVLMEHRAYAGALEWSRLVTLFAMAALSPMPEAVSIGLCVACLFSAPLLWQGRSRSPILAQTQQG